MPLNTTTPDDTLGALLRLVAAAAERPEQRLRLVNWMSATLAMLGVETATPACATVPPPVLRALEELSASLSMAADHAEALTEHARLKTPAPQAGR